MNNNTGIVAGLRYLASDSPPPVYHSNIPGKEERSEGKYVDVPVTIGNARTLSTKPDLDREGFVLFQHGTLDVDFESPDSIVADYYPQVAELLRQRLAADRVIVFDHNIRIDAVKEGVRKPARLVHVDYTVRSAVRRAIDLVEENGLISRLRRRFMQINVWRPLHHAVLTSPLALADASTISDGDYVRAEIIYPERRGEILELTHNPEHQWFYYPEMSPDEMLVFKGYDSDPAFTSGGTPHTAFDDPATAVGAPPRHSIELRAMAYF